MRKQRDSVEGMTWMEYVTRHAGTVQREIATAAGVTPSAVSRWSESTPKPEVVATFARHFGRPVLEAFIAAGFLTPTEAGEVPSATPSLTSLSDEELLEEVAKRMREGGSSASTDVPPKKSGGGGEPRSLSDYKRRRLDDAAQLQQDAADHPDDDPR